jgi:hypothetical protein
MFECVFVHIHHSFVCKHNCGMWMRALRQPTMHTSVYVCKRPTDIKIENVTLNVWLRFSSSYVSYLSGLRSGHLMNFSTPMTTVSWPCDRDGMILFVYIHTYIYTYIQTYIHTYIYMYVHIYIYIYIYIYTFHDRVTAMAWCYVYICIFIYMYMYIYICICIYIYIHTHLFRDRVTVMARSQPYDNHCFRCPL